MGLGGAFGRFSADAAALFSCSSWASTSLLTDMTVTKSFPGLAGGSKEAEELVSEIAESPASDMLGELCCFLASASARAFSKNLQ